MMNSIAAGSDDSNPLLAAALNYARLGWAVLPLHTIINGKCSCGKPECDSPGKHPATLHGAKDATTDEAIIRRWWHEYPTANIGIATGERFGVFMLGPDGQAGIEALAMLELEQFPLPASPRARSGGGGEHRYFAWPDGGGIRNLANINGLPIDVRGEGGFAVAPPSLHVSGQRYEWIDPPQSVRVPPAPEWLVTWLRSAKGTSAKKERNEHTTILTVVSDDFTSANGVPEGARHAEALRLAGLHLGRGEPRDAVLKLAIEWASRCQPPMNADEITRIVNDISVKETESQDQGRAADPPADGNIETLPMPQAAPWPRLRPEALHGLAGSIVNTITPQTEADPVAILIQLLVAFGNAVGRGPHYMVEGDSHHGNLFACLVGESSRGRKGTSRGRVMQIMQLADSGWQKSCETTGLSSGEGLIWRVRDPIEAMEPIKQKGKITGTQKVVRDEGVKDKRLIVFEGEFGMVLRVLQRDGNSLSPVIRQAWDTGRLTTLVKNNPASATDAHISIAGHITRPELTKYLKNTELFNGFANRFLWICVRRARLLPDGGEHLDLTAFGMELGYALSTARNIRRMTRTDAATRVWREVYPVLTDERPGVYGAVTGRAEAQVLRISMIFTLLDGKDVIDEPHLRAALAVWDYSQLSAAYIFGVETEDPLVVMILAKLTAAAAGLTRTQLHDAFSRNLPAPKILEALAKLRDRGDAYAVTERTAGRPAERWFARRADPERKNEESPGAPGPEDTSFFRTASDGDQGTEEVEL